MSKQDEHGVLKEYFTFLPLYSPLRAFIKIDELKKQFPNEERFNLSLEYLSKGFMFKTLLTEDLIKKLKSSSFKKACEYTEYVLKNYKKECATVNREEGDLKTINSYSSPPITFGTSLF